jgi:hypothetical protein
VASNTRDFSSETVFTAFSNNFASAENRVPPHDVVVTNPPYSADHVQRIIKWYGDSATLHSFDDLSCRECNMQPRV